MFYRTIFTKKHLKFPDVYCHFQSGTTSKAIEHGDNEQEYEQIYPFSKQLNQEVII